MPWRLWRQDDNGNRFLVGEYNRKSDAETQLAELTRHIHKQTYWLEERPVSGRTVEQ